MAENWRIPRRTRVCARTGENLDVRRPFYSALVEKSGPVRAEDIFERLDFSAEAWPGVDKAAFLSFWRNKGKETESGRPAAIDYDRLQDFFDRLEGAPEPGRRLFRYVLALILVRRRRLRLEGMVSTPEGDLLRLYDRRDGGRSLEALAPEAGREELEKIQERLNQIFDGDFAELDPES